jgi:hypothetical protein
LKPQVDEVFPATLARGGHYKLHVTGRNLSPGTALEFGDGITLVGAPIVTSPTSAEVEVLVSPAAAATTRAVGASNDRGRTVGPGAVLIAVAPPPTPPAGPVPGGTTLVAHPHYHQPHGNIVLDSPCDADALFSSSCKEPPLLTDSTVFLWHEETLGLAKAFVLEIVDGSGKVLASAQTAKPWFHVTAALLASLPRVESGAALSARPRGNETGASVPIVVTGAKNGMDLARAQTQALARSFHLPGAPRQAPEGGKPAGETLIVLPPVVPDRPKSPGEVAWRVRGLGNAINEATGLPTSQLIEVERSDERAIRLPLPPNGFSCEGGSSLGTPAGRGDPLWIALLGPRPKPCEGNSSNICSGWDFAEISETVRIDASRVPFPLLPVGNLKTSSQVTFENVFVDWGDGSQPEKLTVDGGPDQSLKSLRLARKGTPAWKRLRHRYVNADPAAEWVDYPVRIYSLADQDKTPDFLVALLNARQASQSSPGARGGKAPAPESQRARGYAPVGGAASAGKSDLPVAEATGAAEGLVNGMFTIACATARVYNPLGAGADDPLHLLTAAVVFPTDPWEPVRQAKPAPQKPSGQSPQPAGGAGTDLVASAGVNPFAGSGPIPAISDCSSAFKATARITYWGHGRVRLYWYVDDQLVETQEPPAELPPVSKHDGEAGTHPWSIEMDGVLPTLPVGSHKVRVRVEGGGPKSTGAARHGFDPVALGAGGVPVALGQARVVPPAGGPPPAGLAKAVASTGTFAAGGTTDLGPHTEVESKDRLYGVFDHKSKNIPCSLRYPTQKSGVLEISDLGSFTKAGTGAGATYSGTGLLKLILPANGGDADSVQPVPVAFSGWKLGPSSAGGEDVLDVLSGTLDQTLANQNKKAANFPVRLTRVRLAPAEASLDGDVSVGNDMGLKAASASDLPRWDFAGAALDPGGGFAFASSKQVQAEIGASQFLLKIGSAQVDLSRHQGSAPASTCAASAADVGWLGVRLGGTLQSPSSLQFGGAKLLPDRSFSQWGLTPSGLDVKDSDPSYEKILAASVLKIKAQGFTIAACGGTFSAVFGIQVSNVPLILDPIAGVLSIDEQSAVHPLFPPIQLQRDWGTVQATITKAEFSYQQVLGGWGVAIDAHLQFLASSKPVFETDYPGLLAALDGALTGPTGQNFFSAGAGQSASLAGFPLQVTQLGAGNGTGGDLWLGFRGDLEVGVNAPTAKDQEVKFLLHKTGGAAARGERPGIVLASYRAGGPPPPPPSGYGPPPGGNDLDVQPVHLEFDFPPADKLAHISVDASWEKSGAGYRFLGDGNVEIVGAFGIPVSVLFGRANGESFWMVRAGYTLPAPMVLGSTPLGLMTIGGGLGYNITAASYEKTDVKQIVIDGSKNYSFSADVGVGTLDNAFTLFFDGRMTIKLGDGLRLDVKAWLLSDDHPAGSQMGEGCVQYMSGSFDAGFAVKASIADGLVSVDAPGGSDVCTTSAVNIHFGKGQDWHIWIGTEDNPVTAHVLVVDNKGWVTIDGSGVHAGLKAHTTKKYCLDFKVCEACAWFEWGYHLKVGIDFHPVNVSGGVGGGVGCGIDVCGFGMSVDGSASLAASINPTQVCGSVSLTVHTPNWFPNVDFSRDLCLP